MGLLRLIVPTALLFASFPSLGSAASFDRCPLNGSVVIEEVQEESTQLEATLRPGDVLLSWRSIAPTPWQVEREGLLVSPFDFLELLEGPAAREGVELTLVRSGETIILPLAPAAQTVVLRPLLAGKDLEHYTQAKAALAAGDFGWAAHRLEATGEQWSRRGEHALACWFFLRGAEARIKARDHGGTDTALGRALGEAEETGNQRLLSQVWGLSGDLLKDANEYERAAFFLHRALSLRQQAAGKDITAAMILYRLGVIDLNQRNLAAADEKYQQALAIISAVAPEGREQAQVLDGLGANISYRRGDIAAADPPRQRALEIRRKVVPGSLAFAKSLVGLGLHAYARGELDRAEQLFREAMAIQERLAPRSLDFARTVHDLGNVLYSRGNLAEAERFFLLSLHITEEVAPESLDIADSLTNLGSIAYNREDLDTAEDLFKRALALQEKFAVSGLSLAPILQNLGNVRLVRGDLDAAEELYRRSLAIEESAAPGSLEHGQAFEMLGIVAHGRNDLKTAKDYLLKALQVREQQAPDSLIVAHNMDLLGVIAHLMDDQIGAERFLRRAMAIRERLAPDSTDLADSLMNLGGYLSDRGEFAEAETLLRRALELNESLSAPLSAAGCLHNLGSMARRRNRFPEAESLIRRALVVRERITPGTTDEVSSLHELALIEQHLGRKQEALALFLRAVNGLEEQAERIGGAQDVEATFLARGQELFQDTRALLLELHRAPEALALTERYRGRIMLRMLADRTLHLDQDLPPQLAERLRQIDVEYDRTLSSLADSSTAADGARVESLRSRLRELRDEKAFLVAAVRRASPRLASLRYPQPLDFQGILASLDPGTVLLSYNVGKEQVDLFIVQRGEPLRVQSISFSEEDLRKEVELLRRLIPEARRGRPQEAIRLEQVHEIARHLYTRLVEPAATAIEKSERILILSDGPLLVLPWGLLVRPLPASPGLSRAFQYLAEWKPLHTALSASLAAELKQSRHLFPPDPEQTTFIAFGDPVSPPGRRSFERLPATRQEVREIASLFSHNVVFLGPDATEENAKRRSSGARYLHFATHGLLDENLPLDSALVLTPSDHLDDGGDNGLLQAWEIFEQIHLDADLVVLSACESGLGSELGGEGLLGLTRAFQYAGARTVMASLWNVSDQTTAELMTRFYRHLSEGRAKDEALRETQMELIQHPIRVTGEKGENTELDASYPFYWAAFQIYGDWR